MCRSEVDYYLVSSLLLYLQGCQSIDFMQMEGKKKRSYDYLRNFTSNKDLKLERYDTSQF